MRPEMLQSFTVDDSTPKKKKRNVKTGDIRLRNVPPEKPFPKKKRNLSKAARARISQAQKARWAKHKTIHVNPGDQIIIHPEDIPGYTEKCSAAFVPLMSGKTEPHVTPASLTTVITTIEVLIEKLTVELGVLKDLRGR